MAFKGQASTAPDSPNVGQNGTAAVDHSTLIQAGGDVATTGGTIADKGGIIGQNVATKGGVIAGNTSSQLTPEMVRN